MDINRRRLRFYRHQPKGDPSDPQPLRRRRDVLSGAFGLGFAEKLFRDKASPPRFVRRLRDGGPTRSEAALEPPITGAARSDPPRDRRLPREAAELVAATWDKQPTGSASHGRARLAARIEASDDLAEDGAPEPGWLRGCGLLVTLLLLAAALALAWPR